MAEPMKIKVVLFALAKQIAGSNSVDIELSRPATIADLKHSLAEKLPALKDIISRSAFAVDHEYAVDSMELHGGMEIGLIPPVSGG